MMQYWFCPLELPAWLSWPGLILVLASLPVLAWLYWLCFLPMNRVRSVSIYF